MKKKVIWVSSLIVFFIVLFLICINWYFPYSPISFTKSISYDADNIVVKAYKKELNDFKNIYNSKKKNTLTDDRTQYVLPMFEQQWLVSGKPVKIKESDQLNTMLNEVKETKDILIELAFREKYSQETKEYLKMALVTCLSLENEIVELKNSKFHSRSTLNRQIRNLHMSFIRSFDMFTTFYKEYHHLR
ncbi:hypothetical protein [Heyndrickxia vini]|uniref:Uncharacterized protein n=1 Tax=Heyndrickxia vini TaxID=1476025 RepID=A0ABX7E006_9BACI|nr:hypothetical protein [Heyndrickxia vini]QQZ09076.1 hypothetical protein I5776_19165 [Heyndrickxia vini]